MADNPEHEARGDRRHGAGLTAGDVHAGEDAAGHDGTVDLSALQADDALLDALGSGESELSGPMSANQIDALLVSWRREVDGEPIGELVDTDTAMTVVTEAKVQQQRRRKHRFLVPLTSAAAVLLIGFSVVGFAARSAQPGDTLWAVTQVLYHDHATSVETAADARKGIDHARVLLHSGESDRSRALLGRVSASLHSVQEEDGRKRLQQNTDALLAKLPQDQSPQPGSSATAPAPPSQPTNGSGSDSSQQSQTNPASEPSSSNPSSEPSSSPTTSPTPTDESGGHRPDAPGDHPSEGEDNGGRESASTPAS